MATRVDLRELAGDRNGSSQPRPIRRRRSWVAIGTRFVVPLVLLAAFIGILTWTVRESFIVRVPVSVIPVLSLRTEVESPETLLFQGAGWVEPRPTPVTVSALEEGVVERLEVIEGQMLKAGDEIARLIDADAKLAVRGAQAEVRSRTAELASATANLAAAEIRLREPLDRMTAVAEAEALLARVENDLARIPSQLKTAQARSAYARKEVQIRTQTEGLVSKLALEKSRTDSETADATIAELTAQRAALKKEQQAQSARVSALKRLLELKTEETRAVADARAQVELAESKITLSQVQLQKAQLRLERLVIRAPQSGRVLSLEARPGTKVMGLKPTAMADASTIITMYDPASLQIRADVRLEHVARVQKGHPVQITTAALGTPLSGEVIATTSFTDIQKNTVQVKVAIHDPPDVLKPDMLVQVTFLSPPSTTRSSGPDSALRLVIPAEVVQKHEGKSSVWIADQTDNVARQRTIRLGGFTPRGLREVLEGLHLGDRLIVQPPENLKPGMPIEIREAKPETRLERPTQNVKASAHH